MNGETGARLALGLDRAVVVALLEGEAADQRADRPVLRVEGDQRALCGGNLYEAQGAVFLALHADLVAGLGHVGGLARHRAHAVVAEEGRAHFMLSQVTASSLPSRVITMIPLFPPG